LIDPDYARWLPAVTAFDGSLNSLFCHVESATEFEDFRSMRCYEASMALPTANQVGFGIGFTGEYKAGVNTLFALSGHVATEGGDGIQIQPFVARANGSSLTVAL
jgi:hypothetical protein